MDPFKTPIEPLQMYVCSPVNNLNFRFQYQFSEMLPTGQLWEQERVQGPIGKTQGLGRGQPMSQIHKCSLLLAPSAAAAVIPGVISWD